jgi:hypothetical protein
MINMMYLVLTALLALNVSKEILDSFVTVNNGLENTKSTSLNEDGRQYTHLRSSLRQGEREPSTARPGTNAQKMQPLASASSNYIDTIKAKRSCPAEGLPTGK